MHLLSGVSAEDNYIHFPKGGKIKMKNYTITVNGNVYDVVVEEGKTNGVTMAAAPAAPAAAQNRTNLPSPLDILCHPSCVICAIHISKNRDVYILIQFRIYEKRKKR